MLAILGHPRRLLLVGVALTLALTAIALSLSHDARSAVTGAHEQLGLKLCGSKSDQLAPGHNASEPLIRRENAVFYTLCRNSDLQQILAAIRSVESQFNNRYHYDWVFLNDDEFSETFKDKVSQHVSGEAKFGLIPTEHWGIPDWIDTQKTNDALEWMREHNVLYGDLMSYHLMCRFEAAFFYQHPLLENVEFMWRVEPSIKILCRIDRDPFTFMRENDLNYGFNIAPYDIKETVTTLWDSTRKFLDAHPDYIAENNLANFISDDNLESYNYCHFWTNFEISRRSMYTTPQYQEYVDFLDREGGFFYERWGDAPIRSIAASLFFDKSKVHFFNEIGYFHSPYGHCPFEQGPLELQCSCHPNENEFENLAFFDYHENSCLRKYFQAKGRSYRERNPKFA